MQCLDLPINKLVNEQIANNAQWSQCVNIEIIPMKCLADVSGKELSWFLNFRTNPQTCWYKRSPFCQDDNETGTRRDPAQGFIIKN